jgi:hypothetical protein
MTKELYTKLTDFIDLLETEYGSLAGVEIKLSHPIVNGAEQGCADIEGVYIHHIIKEEIKLK